MSEKENPAIAPERVSTSKSYTDIQRVAVLYDTGMIVRKRRSLEVAKPATLRGKSLDS